MSVGWLIELVPGSEQPPSPLGTGSAKRHKRLARAVAPLPRGLFLVRVTWGDDVTVHQVVEETGRDQNLLGVVVRQGSVHALDFARGVAVNGREQRRARWIVASDSA